MVRFCGLSCLAVAFSFSSCLDGFLSLHHEQSRSSSYGFLCVDGRSLFLSPARAGRETKRIRFGFDLDEEVEPFLDEIQIGRQHDVLFEEPLLGDIIHPTRSSSDSEGDHDPSFDDDFSSDDFRGISSSPEEEDSSDDSSELDSELKAALNDAQQNMAKNLSLIEFLDAAAVAGPSIAARRPRRRRVSSGVVLYVSDARIGDILNVGAARVSRGRRT